MATYSSVTGNLASSASAAYTVGQGLIRAIAGDSRKVHFIQNYSTIIEFDAVVSEQHSQDAGPTVFPLEDGSTITDHIIVPPFELTLSGVITDSKIQGKDGDESGYAGVNGLQREVVTSAANAAAGPLGVLGVGAAAAFSPTIAAQRGSTSPSALAYNALNLLIAGNKATGIMPAPFDVVTSLKRYPNMILRSLQVPRDASTGNALVFNMSLIQLLLVRPQTTTIKAFTNAAVSAHKAALGDKETQQPSKEAMAFGQGRVDLRGYVPQAVVDYSGTN